MNNKVLLLIAAVLILLGLGKFDMSNINPFPNKPNSIDVLELPTPTDPNVLKEAQEVVDLLKSSSVSRVDFRKLRDLMLDLGQLVSLDGDNEVIKTTDEIRQANSIAGPMLRLDMKGKYPNLAKEAQDVVVAAIGDDSILLSKELRPKAVEGFNALAWAYNEGSK